jgi:rSAM/selenodomain-associated transferase 1
LTEFAFQQARSLAQEDGVSLELHFAGGTEQRVRDWLGPEFLFQTQAAGDLGERLHQAFGHAFSAGNTAVIIMGSDCPGLTAGVLRRAFAALAESDMVLGPAADGGYYLIGLSRPAPALFTDIPWSSSEVLARTLARAADLGLKTHLLGTLCDVDRPQDLAQIPRRIRFANG